MKKFTKSKTALAAVAIFVAAWSCKKDDAVVAVVVPPVVAKLTYETDLKAIFVTKCTPCHLNVTGGYKTNKWDDYATVKTNIALILDRVQRDPTATGYMPRVGSGNTGLTAAEIAKLKQWVTDGSLEK